MRAELRDFLEPVDQYTPDREAEGALRATGSNEKARRTGAPLNLFPCRWSSLRLVAIGQISDVALRSGAGAVVVQTLDPVLLRVAEAVVDPEAVSTQQRRSLGGRNSSAIPAPMSGKRGRRAGLPPRRTPSQPCTRTLKGRSRCSKPPSGLGVQARGQAAARHRPGQRRSGLWAVGPPAAKHRFRSKRERIPPRTGRSRSLHWPVEPPEVVASDSRDCCCRAVALREEVGVSPSSAGAPPSITRIDSGVRPSWNSCQWPSVSPHWRPLNSPLVAIVSPRWWPSDLPTRGHRFSPAGGWLVFR